MERVIAAGGLETPTYFVSGWIFFLGGSLFSWPLQDRQIRTKKRAMGFTLSSFSETQKKLIIVPKLLPKTEKLNSL